MTDNTKNCKRWVLLADDYIGMLRILETLINATSDLKVRVVARNVDQVLKHSCLACIVRGPDYSCSDCK